MVGGYDLGEPLWFSAVGLVAPRAEDGGIELCGLNAGIISMVCERTVTCLAGDYNVLSLTLLLNDVSVASLTRLMASMDDGLSSDFCDRGPTEVAVLAKTLGNNRCAHNHKCREDDQHECSQADEVLYVLEQVRLPGNAIRITSLDSCTSHLPGGR